MKRNCIGIVLFFDGGYVMWAYPISFTVGMIAMLLYFLSPGWKCILAHKEISADEASESC